MQGSVALEAHQAAPEAWDSGEDIHSSSLWWMHSLWLSLEDLMLQKHTHTRTDLTNEALAYISSPIFRQLFDFFYLLLYIASPSYPLGFCTQINRMLASILLVCLT